MSEAATANDLFISYAHIDNLPITEDERGWITEFHRILENRLAQLMGNSLVSGVTKSLQVTIFSIRKSLVSSIRLN